MSHPAAPFAHRAAQLTRTALLALALTCAGAAARAQEVGEPPNAPAEVWLADTAVTLRYHGVRILDARIARPDSGVTLAQLTDSAGGRVTQVLKWTARRGRITVSGIVQTSAEGFAASCSDRRIEPDGRDPSPWSSGQPPSARRHCSCPESPSALDLHAAIRD